MKILYIIDSLAMGGKERQLVELLKGLSTRTDIISQVVILSDNIHYSYVRDLNVKIILLKRRIKHDPKIFFQLYNICMKFQPDVVHSWEPMCTCYAIPVVKVLGIKFVNGIIRNAPSKLKRFGRAWFRIKLTFPFSDIILSNSYAGLNSYGVPRQKRHCIYNGFDLARTRNLTDEETIRNRFEIQTENVVGMVARFHIKKDYKTFLFSAAHVLEKRNNVTFLAVGDGNDLEECKNLIKPRFRQRIKFLGRQGNVESIINILDVGVLLTDPDFHGEGISNSIMEYMALAKPAVATNDGGTGEIVDNEKTGFLVEPKNEEAVVRKIDFLLDNRKIARDMGNAGKQRLQKEFSLEKITDKYIKLYKDLLLITSQ